MKKTAAQNKDLVLLTALIATAFGLSAYQMWYLSLPLERAASVDWCRFSASVDCFRSLAKHGAAQKIFGLGAITTLFGLLLAQTLFCAFGWTARNGERTALFAATKCVSFASSAVAFYLLFHDITAADATSLSTIGISFFGLIVNVLVVVRGLGATQTASNMLGKVAIFLAAASVAALLDAAGDARRDVDSALRLREAAPVQVHWPRFFRAMPRTRAARLGDNAATDELLILFDPQQEKSRALVAQLLRRLPELERRYAIYLYAPGENGRQLMEAHARGELVTYLRSWNAPPPQEDWSKSLSLWQERAARELGAKTYPLVVTKAGRDSKLPAR